MQYRLRVAASVFRVSVLTAATLLLSGALVHADPLNCNLDAYRAQPGLTANVADDTLALTWDGDPNQEVRLRLTIDGGTPTIRDVALRRQGAAWTVLAENVTPEFRVESGLRRITQQQLRPLQGLGVEITDEVIDRHKWDAFWDAPLNLPGGEAAHGNSTPPLEGVGSQPGLPRSPDEVKRGSASYSATGCEVKTNGAHLEVSFPGVELGVFAGRLQYTVFKGTNLIRQEVIAKTEEPSVAYKYEAGLNGLDIQPASRMVWRDISNLWQDYRFGGTVNEGVVPLRSANRVVVAERDGGSIAAFPPPHDFFFARETEVNLGYSYYRKDSETAYAFGVRQAGHEEKSHAAGRGPEDTSQNFALHSARPGTWQHMPIYFYVSEDGGRPTITSALAFTRQDRYKPLPGYQVMASHFHTSMVRRIHQDYGGNFDFKLPDFEAAKAVGIDIFAPVEAGRGEDRLQSMADKYEIARRHSDENFVVWPNEEDFSGNLGGHNDLLISKPLFWMQERAEGQPFVENHPTYGKVYNIGSPADMMEMARLENVIIYMPHPDSKGSTGFPRAIADTNHFRNEYYRGIGFRWGMGVDGSETRLCEYRCLELFDEMNNWVADVPTPPKYIHAITETYRRAPGDDIYANNPVNYLMLDTLPPPGDWTPIVDAMKRGDYFVTSGEVLIPSYAVEGTGSDRTVVAQLEWTFPLEFVELVWGDGQKTDRQIISATDLLPFGSKQFTIPFDATGKKWVRFAAWDTAGNGAMVMPIKLQSAMTTSP